MEKNKYELNARQITKYASQTRDGKFRLVDFVDNLDTIHKTKGVYNKKILVNINSSKDGSTHKEKYAAFYLDMDEMLILGELIKTGRFKDVTFPMAKAPGSYMKYGGGQVSRILNITYQDGRYMLQIALYGAKKTSSGAVIPDKNNKIDSHSIQVPEYELMKMVKSIETHIQAKLANMLVVDNIYTPKQENVKNEPVLEEKKVVKEEKKKEETPFDDDFLMFMDME